MTGLWWHQRGKEAEAMKRGLWDDIFCRPAARLITFKTKWWGSYEGG